MEQHKDDPEITPGLQENEGDKADNKKGTATPSQ